MMVTPIEGVIKRGGGGSSRLISETHSNERFGGDKSYEKVFINNKNPLFTNAIVTATTTLGTVTPTITRNSVKNQTNSLRPTGQIGDGS